MARPNWTRAQRYEIAARAGVSERTVARYVDGEAMRGGMRYAIEQAARALKLLPQPRGPRTPEAA